MQQDLIVSWRAKLTPRQVKAIRKSYAAGVGQLELAKKYGVTQGTISNLLLGKVYRRVKS